MKLTKIKLLNWHIFSDNVINFEGNTLITGDNGNGKSTLIDSIFYVLSGGDEKNFNSAANDDSRRTITTYMRGKLGIENKEFLRNGADIVTHIALEFYDDFADRSQILGSVLTIKNSSNPRSKFYIALNSSIDNLSFISEDNEIYDFNGFKKANVKNDITELKDTYVGRRAQIAQFLNVTDSKKYFELLKKAIAFKPINTDVSDFVFTFLLKEDDIKMDSLSRELSGYKEIQQTIEREKDKLTCLETFIDKAKQYVENERDIKYLAVLKEEVNVKTIQQDINKKERKITELKQQEQNSDIEIKNIADKITQKSNEIEQFESKGELKSLKEKADQLKFYQQEKNNVDVIIEEITDDLLFEMDLMPKAGLNYDFIKDIKSGNIILLNEHIKEYLRELENAKGSLNRDIAIKQSEQSTIEKRNYSLNQDLYYISQGKNNYEKKVTDLKNIIEKHLKEKYGKDIRVLHLCECIDIVDKDWTNAIEGYLGSQRFDLIIAPEYFYDAAEIYEKFTHEYNLYSVGVVNTGVTDEFPVVENSLYSKISVINPYAKSICKRILGRVVCVDSVRNFKPRQTCITRTCMTYRNDTAKAIDPKNYSKPYIGKDSLSKREAIIKEELNENKGILEQIKSEIKESGIKLNTLQRSRITKREIKNYWTEQKILEQNIEDLQKEINERSQNQDIIHLTVALEQLREQRKELYDNKSAVQAEQEKIIKYLQDYSNQKFYSEQKLNEAKIAFKSAYDAIQDIEGFKLFSSDFALSGKVPSFEIERKTRVNSNYKEAIKRGMREYSKEYNANLTDEIECVNDYIIEYNKIHDTGLAIKEAQADEAFKNAQLAFQENFISKIRDKILYVERELKRINDNLKRHPFGRDMETYEFVKKPSGDQEMREYARIIMSGKDIDQKDLFTETLNARDREIMQGLFDRLAAIHNESKVEKDSDKYLDYRQYYQYDIKIKNKNQEELYFSKISKERSSGEMQTPFYVIMGSCFDELVKRDERVSSACVVALDEAFNNMDEPRIITLMNYYKNLNIQLLIVVPTNRSYVLVPYVDSAVSIIKRNNNVYETYLING